jgi:hypothetical protein
LVEFHIDPFHHRLPSKHTNFVTRTRLSFSRSLMNKSKLLPTSASKRLLVVRVKKCKYIQKRKKEILKIRLAVKLVRTLLVS